MNPEHLSRHQLMCLATIFEGGLAILAWVLAYFLGHPILEYLVIEPESIVRGFLATIPMLFLFFFCILVPIGPLRAMKEFTDRVVRPLFSQCDIFDLIYISLLAGIGEELLFRGVLQPVFASWTGNIAWGIAGAAIVFGLFHLINLTYFVLATGIGVYLGCIAYYFDNVLDSILAHALYDFVALVVLVKFQGKKSKAEAGE